MDSAALEPFAPVIRKLFSQQSLEQNEGEMWRLLHLYQHQIRAYLEKIGLILCLYEDDGYACLDEGMIEDETGGLVSLPPLQRTYRLNWHEMMLGRILREQLYIHETQQLHRGSLVMTKTQLRNALLPFTSSTQTHTVATLRPIDQAITRFVKLGYLRQVTDLKESTQYEVRRIVKARFTPDVLARFIEDCNKREEDYE